MPISLSKIVEHARVEKKKKRSSEIKLRILVEMIIALLYIYLVGIAKVNL